MRDEPLLSPRHRLLNIGAQSHGKQYSMSFRHCSESTTPPRTSAARLTFQHYHQLTDFHIFITRYIWGDMDAFIIDGLGECFEERVEDAERG